MHLYCKIQDYIQHTVEDHPRISLVFESILKFADQRSVTLLVRFVGILLKIRRIIIANKGETLFFIAKHELPNRRKENSAPQLVLQLWHIHHFYALHCFCYEFIVQFVKDMGKQIFLIFEKTEYIRFVDIRSLDDGFGRSFIQAVFCNDRDCPIYQSVLHVIVLHGK